MYGATLREAVTNLHASHQCPSNCSTHSTHLALICVCQEANHNVIRSLRVLDKDNKQIQDNILPCQKHALLNFCLKMSKSMVTFKT